MAWGNRALIGEEGRISKIVRKCGRQQGKRRQEVPTHTSDRSIVVDSSPPWTTGFSSLVRRVYALFVWVRCISHIDYK